MPLLKERVARAAASPIENRARGYEEEFPTNDSRASNFQADCVGIDDRAALSVAFAESFTDCIFFLQLLRSDCRAALPHLGRSRGFAPKNCKNYKNAIANLVTDEHR
jgi:hypothetical protein